MIRLTVNGFRKLCEDFGLNLFIFDTSNQRQGVYPDCKLNSAYTNVITMLNPNRVCFKRDNDILCLSRVKHVYMSNSSNIGYVFRIVCGNRDDDNENTSYVIVADRR